MEKERYVERDRQRESCRTQETDSTHYHQGYKKVLKGGERDKKIRSELREICREICRERQDGEKDKDDIDNKSTRNVDKRGKEIREYELKRVR